MKMIVGSLRCGEASTTVAARVSPSRRCGYTVWMDFVVGHPRSGTMFLAHLLNAGGTEVAAHEYLAQLSSRAVSLPTEYYEGRADDEEIRHLLDHYRYSWSPQIRVDSNWKLTWILPPLLRQFPNARIVHLVRDPRENVRSCYNLDYLGELQSRPEFRELERRNFWLAWMPRVRGLDWEAATPLERNCAFWSESHRLAREALDGHPNSLRVRLEDLGSDEVAGQLFARFDLPLPSREQLALARATAVNAKLEMKERVAAHKSLLPRFEQWSAAEQETLRALCGETAQGLGYQLR